MLKYLNQILNSIFEYFNNRFYREYIFRDENICSQCNFYHFLIEKKCRCSTKYKDTLEDYEYQHRELSYHLRRVPSKCPYLDAMMINIYNMNPFKKYIYKCKIKKFYKNKYFFYEGIMRDIQIRIYCNERIK